MHSARRAASLPPCPASAALHLGAEGRRLGAVRIVDDVGDAGLLAQLGYCAAAAIGVQQVGRQAGSLLPSSAAKLKLPGYVQHGDVSHTDICGLEPSPNAPPATTSSAARGAKQLVVVTTQAMASAPSRSTSRRMACMFRDASPSWQLVQRPALTALQFSSCMCRTPVWACSTTHTKPLAPAWAAHLDISDQLIPVQPHGDHHCLVARGLDGLEARLLVDARPQHVPGASQPGRGGRRVGGGRGGWRFAQAAASTSKQGPAARLSVQTCLSTAWQRTGTIPTPFTAHLAVGGRMPRSASSAEVMAMPVASGTTSAAPTSFMPATSSASAASRWVSLASREEPAALGCSAAMSPERPMPCARPQWRRATRGLATRASRSPTPTLSGKLLLSISAASWDRREARGWCGQQGCVWIKSCGRAARMQPQLGTLLMIAHQVCGGSSGHEGHNSPPAAASQWWARPTPAQAAAAG